MSAHPLIRCCLFHLFNILPGPRLCSHFLPSVYLFFPSPWTSSICLSLFYQIKCLYINFMLLQAVGRQWWACDGWVIHSWIEGWFLTFLLKLMALSKVQIDPPALCALITFWIMLWKPLASTKCCFLLPLLTEGCVFFSPASIFVLEQRAVFYCGVVIVFYDFVQSCKTPRTMPARGIHRLQKGSKLQQSKVLLHKEEKKN